MKMMDDADKIVIITVFNEQSFLKDDREWPISDSIHLLIDSFYFKYTCGVPDMNQRAFQALGIKW